MAANTTPLLHSSPAGSPDPVARPPAEAKGRSIETLDEVIEPCVGSAGPGQLFQVLLVCLAAFFDSQQTFISVFTDADPSWHCTASTSTCSSLSDPCSLPPGTWIWDRPRRVSVISEWSLECAGSTLTGLPASAYYIGCLVGGLALATLADSALGRKKMLFLSCLGMDVAGLLAAASPNVWVYSTLRLLGGLCRSTIGTTALILATELVGKKWRAAVGVVDYICFTLGFLSLPAVAYFNRNSSWRALYLWTSAPGLFYSALVYFFVRESPRWLLVRGRTDEAIKTLKAMAASNGKDVSTYSFTDLDIFVGSEEKEIGVYSALRMLVEKRWALRRLAALMAAGFGTGIVYYGMPLAVGSLGSDLYVSVAFNALSELPSAVVTFFLIGRINRRAAILGFTLASGAYSLACVFLGETGLRTGMEVASFFCGCTAVDVVLIYAMELFPTYVRNSALAMAREALALGGVFAPLLVAVARWKGGRLLSFGGFGLLIASGGLLVLWLPETRGGSMCDTLEEEENKEKSAATAGAGGGDGENPNQNASRPTLATRDAKGTRAHW